MKKLILPLFIALFCSCSADKQQSASPETYLAFLKESMPLPDKITYSEEFWLANVEQTIKTREEMNWGIPEREFRHFVLPLRVNNEYLDDFRTTYADTLCRRVKEMSMADAALEVNHWCHEQATYRPSDARTSSPMATMRNAFGRCGEESVLAVSALRAAGIPARQIYTPRWAHTDDNHAWVEVFVDGKWYFMGACEPEPVLNMGWFNSAVSRAMLLHTKAFGNYNGDEDIISHTSAYNEINVTSNYVPVQESGITVVDEAGNAVKGASVEFKIYNYAELYTVAKYTTDEKGYASMKTGIGDMVVWAYKDGKFGIGKTNAKTSTIKLSHNIGDTFGIDIDIIPPAENPIEANPTEEQIRVNAERLAAEDQIRESHIKGNAVVLNQFRANHKENAAKVDFILESLAEKDLEDVSLDVLEDAFAHCSDTMDKYIDCPRVELEYLYPFFTELGEGLAFEGPEDISLWIQENIEIDELHNPQKLRIPPIMVWRSKVSDILSRDIFFVAMCRRFGFAARLDPVSGKVQYCKNGNWHNEYFGGEGETLAPQGHLDIQYTPIPYFEKPENYSIAKIEDGHPIEYALDGKISIDIETGYYMLISGTRMANGSVLSHIEFFNINEGETSRPVLTLRTSEKDVQVIGSFYAEPYIPQTGRGYFAFVFLGDKDEPTNHAVHELEAAAPELNKWGRKILMYGKSLPEGLDNAISSKDIDNEALNSVINGVKSKSAAIPVIAVVDTFGRIVYFSQGYNTSLASDLKRVLNSL